MQLALTYFYQMRQQPMFVLITRRVIKHNTGTTERYQPRTANRVERYVSGPFSSIKAAQRAALHALKSHTCLDAQIWSEEQVRERQSKGYSTNGDVFQGILNEGLRMVELASFKEEMENTVFSANPGNLRKAKM